MIQRRQIRRHWPLWVGTCLLAALASLPALGAPVSIRIRVANSTAISNEPVAAEVQIVSGSSSAEDRTVRVVPVDGSGAIEVDLAGSGVWYLRARAAGYWGDTRVLVAPYPRQPVELRLWPAAILRAQVSPSVRLSSISVRFQPVLDDAAESNHDDTLPASTVDCRLDGRNVECVIPAGVVDYSLRSAGYVPVYRWNQNHSAGQVSNLGSVEFRKGSSLVGRVVARGRRLDRGSKIRVSLEPSRAAIVPAAEEKRSRLAGATAFADARGNFVFEGIKPGGYQIFADAPGLISETREVAILDSLEAELRDPIELAPPVTVEIAIAPATDPWRGKWTVDLLRLDARKRQTAVAASAVADFNGRWTRAGLPPGDYIVNIRRQPQGVWYSQPLAVESDVHLDLDIPFVRVTGTLRLGGAPLPGSLWFGGERGAVSVPITTDDRGLFRGVLPATDGGTWAKVDVVADQPTVRRSLQDLRIPAPDDDGISRLDIDLPSNKVYGEVTTERGTPVSSATIFLSVAGEEGALLQTHVDELGQFSFNGLDAGTYSLRAISDRGKSDALKVAVDQTSQEFMNLVLKQNAELRGVVSSRYGGVAGARVSAYPDDRWGFDLVEWTTTDPDGRFSVIVPPRAHHATLTVAAPGFAFQFFRAAVDSQPVEIQLEQNGGRLLIALQGSDLPFVFYGGGFLALQDLLGDGIAVLDEKQNVVVENLKSGQYELCLASPSEALAFAQTMRPKERCTGGFLPPGGQLLLDAPSTGRPPI